MKIFLIFLVIPISSGVNVSCQFSYVHNYELFLNDSYTCNVVSIDFSEDSNNYVTSLNETQLGLVETLTFGYYYVQCPNLNLGVIPKGLSNIFPNMTALLFYYCPVTHLFGDELEEYTKLEILMIQYFNIIRVPPEIFTYNPNMKFVGFYNNEIQHVGHGLLEHLRFLVRADFRGNICVNMKAFVAQEIPALIEHMRNNCTDIETTTTLRTTTTTLPTTTTPPPRCIIEDLDDFVCGLDEEIEILRERNENLENQVEILTRNSESQAEELRSLAARLDELEQRPCDCGRK